MEKQGGIRQKNIKQILKAHENHHLVLQKYYISNRDILRAFQWYSSLGYSRSVKIILFLSLGSDIITYNLSYFRNISQQEVKFVKFPSLGSHAVTYNLSFH